jgi:hypothetical protein
MTCRSEPNAAPSRSSLVADVEAARAALDRAERALADHDRPTVSDGGWLYRLSVNGQTIESRHHTDERWSTIYHVDKMRSLARLIGTPAVIDASGGVWTGQAARLVFGPVREAVVVEVETP